MGNSIVHTEGNTLKVDDKEYELTPGLGMLILYKEAATSTLYQRRLFCIQSNRCTDPGGSISK